MNATILDEYGGLVSIPEGKKKLRLDLLMYTKDQCKDSVHIDEVMNQCLNYSMLLTQKTTFKIPDVSYVAMNYHSNEDLMMRQKWKMWTEVEGMYL